MAGDSKNTGDVGKNAVTSQSIAPKNTSAPSNKMVKPGSTGGYKTK